MRHYAVKIHKIDFEALFGSSGNIPALQELRHTTLFLLSNVRHQLLPVGLPVAQAVNILQFAKIILDIFQAALQHYPISLFHAHIIAGCTLRGRQLLRHAVLLDLRTETLQYNRIQIFIQESLRKFPDGRRTTLAGSQQLLYSRLIAQVDLCVAPLGIDPRKLLRGIRDVRINHPLVPPFLQILHRPVVADLGLLFGTIDPSFLFVLLDLRLFALT